MLYPAGTRDPAHPAGHRDAWAFSFYFSAIGAVVTLPFVLSRWQTATLVNGWLLMILVGGIILLHNLLNLTSMKHLEVSVWGAMTKFRLLWILVLSVLFLHESLTTFKIAGTVLTIAAGILIVFRYRQMHASRGLWLVGAASVVYAVVILLYKYLFVYYNTTSLTFFIFLFPALFNALFMPQFVRRISELWRTKRRAIGLACSAGAFANLAMNQSLFLGEASRVVVIIEAFLVLTLAGEHVFLKERLHMGAKIAAVVLATLGAILIRV